AERPVVAEVAARWEGARQHVGDGLDAAVGMPGEAGAIVVGPVIAEIVEEQERIELVGIAEAEGAPQLDAGALHGGLRLDDALHGPDGHRISPHVWNRGRMWELDTWRSRARMWQTAVARLS